MIHIRKPHIFVLISYVIFICVTLLKYVSKTVYNFQ